MATILPRHTITETPDIAAAIDQAGRAWPEASGNRAELARRLIVAGVPQAEATTAARLSRRQATVEALAGRFTGLYPSDAAAELKAEWPQ